MFRKFIQLLKDAKKYKNDLRDRYSHVYIRHFEKNAEIFVEIKIIGVLKSQFIKPKEIIHDDKLIECFDPKDIRTLTYLATIDMLKPKYRIISEKVDIHGNKLYVLQEKGNSKPLIFSHDEIIEKNMKKYFNVEDSFNLGEKNIDHEQKLINELSKKITFSKKTGNYR